MYITTLHIPAMPDAYPELIRGEAQRRIAELERERARSAERRLHDRRRKALRPRRRRHYAPAREAR